MILREAAGIVALGLAAGLPLALAASQAIRSLLFGVTPESVHVYAIAGVVLAGAALLAAWAPARAASRLAPAETLRGD